MLTVGSVGAFRSPLFAAGLYLWIAYFRPEGWVYTSFFASLYPSVRLRRVPDHSELAAGISLTPTWRSMLLLLFLALSAASAIFGLHRDVSFLFLQAFAKTVLISYLFTAIIQKQSDLRFVLIVIACSSSGIRSHQTGMGATDPTPAVRTTFGIDSSATTIWWPSEW